MRNTRIGKLIHPYFYFLPGSDFQICSIKWGLISRVTTGPIPHSGKHHFDEILENLPVIGSKNTILQSFSTAL